MSSSPAAGQSSSYTPPQATVTLHDCYATMGGVRLKEFYPVDHSGDPVMQSGPKAVYVLTPPEGRLLGIHIIRPPSTSCNLKTRSQPKLEVRVDGKKEVRYGTKRDDRSVWEFHAFFLLNKKVLAWTQEPSVHGDLGSIAFAVAGHNWTFLYRSREVLVNMGMIVPTVDGSSNRGGQNRSPSPPNPLVASYGAFVPDGSQIHFETSGDEVQDLKNEVAALRTALAVSEEARRAESVTNLSLLTTLDTELSVARRKLGGSDEPPNYQR